MTIFDITIPEKVIYPIITVLVSYILIMTNNMFFNRLIKLNKIGSKHARRSQNTVYSLMKNIFKTIIIIITIITILKIFEVNTTAIVTSVAGVSVVVGLIFQDILKDYLVGITIILESQFALGEIVEINGFKGEVIYLGLKTTKLKSYKGEVRIISNRNISEITNYSLNKNLATFNISVSYEDDLNKVEKVIKDVINKLKKEEELIEEDIIIDGIDELSDSAVVYRISTKLSNRDIPVVKRIINKEIKLAFDKNNIKIPYPQVEVHNER